MTAPSETGRPEGSTFLLDQLDRLSPPILRLPGGDRLNNWSYLKGASELDDPAGQGKPMHVPDFLKLSAAAHATPLWGVNVTTADPAETAAFAKILIRDKADTSFFELGNELYLRRWNEMTKTAEIYARKAAPHAAVLRKMFPHAKLGVPLASYYMLRAPVASPAGSQNGLRQPDKLDPWILDMAQKTDYYDAVVLHLYVVPTELGPKGLATHTADEVRRWAWSRADPEQVRDVFGLVHGIFPDKEIWVTEWAFNSTQYIGRGKSDPRFRVHQTMLAVLYNARFMLNTAYEVPYVPIMTYWTLYGQQTVALLRDGKPTINDELFRLMRLARQGADGLARLDLGNAPILKGPTGPQGFDKLESKAADVFGFFRGKNLASVVLLNVEPTAATFAIPSLPEGGSTHGWSLSSRDLLPDWGKADNPGPDNWNPPFTLEKIESNGRIVTAPPNSLSVLSIAGAR